MIKHMLKAIDENNNQFFNHVYKTYGKNVFLLFSIIFLLFSFFHQIDVFEVGRWNLLLAAGWGIIYLGVKKNEKCMKI